MVTVRLQTPPVTVGQYVSPAQVRRDFMAGDVVSIPQDRGAYIPYRYMTDDGRRGEGDLDLKPGDAAVVFLPSGNIARVVCGREVTSAQLVARIK